MFDSYCLGKCWRSQGAVLLFWWMSPEAPVNLDISPTFPCCLRQAYAGYPSDPGVPLKSTPQGELEVSMTHVWLWATTFGHSIRVPGPVKVSVSDGSWLIGLRHQLPLLSSCWSGQGSNVRIRINPAPALSVVWATPTSGRGGSALTEDAKGSETRGPSHCD